MLNKFDKFLISRDKISLNAIQTNLIKFLSK